MKKETALLAGILIAICATALGILAIGSQAVRGEITAYEETPASLVINQRLFATSTSQTIFSTTTSATSTNITAYNDANGRIDNGKVDIRGADTVVWYFSRGGSTGPNTGATRFEVEVSPDGDTWYDFNRLIGTDSSATATTTVTISAATSTVVYGMDLDYHSFKFARCIVVEFTDGEHSCSVLVTY